MIEPLNSLAFSVYSKKGTYGLLLGSGVSRSAGIPTGWEVVLDLVRKLAKLENEDCDSDPAEWFHKKHGSAPDYSKLLDALVKTPTERHQLLRPYFEGTKEERAQKIKTPSVAHRAIAQLISDGYIRVVLTTNFDRMLEEALQDLGKIPTVLSTVDQIAGTLPLVHSGVTLIKLHGDYLDTRIKNTEAELGAYEIALSTLLDRILEEYGLIICGWSADWDSALRAAIERCPTRRFNTFWTARAALSQSAKKLVEHRRAELIQIQNADQFFQELGEKVRSLSDLDGPHPLSAKMAVATVKRYLVDSASRIRLRDFVHAESEKLVAALTEQAFPGSTTLEHPTELNARVQRYNGLTDILVSILVTGCYWGDATHEKLWNAVLQRIKNIPNPGNGLVYLINLRKYPSLRLFYAAGIASVAASKHSLLIDLLTRITVKENGKSVPLPSVLHPMSVMENNIGHFLPGLDRRRTPLSDYLFGDLRDILREYLPSDDDYTAAFDRFEYLLGATVAEHLKNEYHEGVWWGPVGCFSWRGRDFGEHYMPAVIARELKEHGDSWPLLKAGLWGGSESHANTAFSKFNAHLGRLPYF